MQITREDVVRKVLEAEPDLEIGTRDITECNRIYDAVEAEAGGSRITIAHVEAVFQRELARGAAHALALQNGGRGLHYERSKISQRQQTFHAFETLLSHQLREGAGSLTDAYVSTQPTFEPQPLVTPATAKLFEDSGLVAPSVLPGFATPGNKPDFSRFMRGMVESLKGIVPDDVYAKLKNLQFERKEGSKGMMAEVRKYFFFTNPWAGDLKKVWDVVIGGELKEGVLQQTTQRILDYTNEYLGLGDGPSTPYSTEVFSFEGLTLDWFCEAAVKKGRLNGSMSLLDVEQAIALKLLDLSPQGLEFIRQLKDVANGGKTSLDNAFAILRQIKIEPYGPGEKGHDGTIAIAGERVTPKKLKERLHEVFSPNAVFQSFVTNRFVQTVEEGHGFRADAAKTQWVVGDGLAGEIGFFKMREAIAAGASVYAPDIALPRSQVAAAAAYLGLINARKQDESTHPSDLIIHGGQVLVGAANVMDAERVAATVDAILPEGAQAIYASLAYAAGQSQEAALVASGTQVAAKLKALGRLAGVLRLQSPSTPNEFKNDTTPFQGPWYLLAQFLKVVSSLNENSKGTPSLAPRWPVVLSFSLLQSALMSATLGKAPALGIRTATPEEAGSMAFMPLASLMTGDAILGTTSAFGLANDGHAQSHPKPLMSVLWSAIREVVGEKIKALPGKLFARKPKRASVASDFEREQMIGRAQAGTQNQTYLLPDAASLSAYAKSFSGPLAEAIVGAITFERPDFVLAGSMKERVGMALLGKGIIGEILFKSRNAKAGDGVVITTTSTAPSGVLSSASVMDKDGNQIVFSVSDDNRLFMSLSPGENLQKSLGTPEYRTELQFDRATRTLKVVASTAVNPALAKKTFTLKNSFDVQQAALAYQQLQLGQLEGSLTLPVQHAVEAALRELAKPEWGVDLTRVTIHSMQFNGNFNGDLGQHLTSQLLISKITPVVRPDKKTGVNKSVGQMVEGNILLSSGSVSLGNVRVSLFVNGNKVSDATGAIEKVKAGKALRSSASGFQGSITMMNLDELRRFARAGGDPNIIHHSNLVGGMISNGRGAISPAFGIAAELEAWLRRRFTAAVVTGLTQTNHRPLLPGKSYTLVANPVADKDGHYTFQIQDRGRVCVEGSFGLAPRRVAVHKPKGGGTPDVVAGASLAARQLASVDPSAARAHLTASAVMHRSGVLTATAPQAAVSVTSRVVLHQRTAPVNRSTFLQAGVLGVMGARSNVAGGLLRAGARMVWH